MVSEATRQSYRDFLKQQAEITQSASEHIFINFGIKPSSNLGWTLIYNFEVGMSIQVIQKDNKKWISLSYYSGTPILHSIEFDDPADAFEQCIIETREKISSMLNTLPQRKEG